MFIRIIARWIQGLFTPTPPQPSAGQVLSDYDRAKAALARDDLDARLFLARSDETPPEMLYFLAEDADARVRQRVAANTHTPPQAHHLLVDDSAGSVRGELARKLARLMPDMAQGEASDLRDDVISMLEHLGRDEESRVRAILAEEIATLANAPVDLVRHLALDPISEVASNVLEFSPLLADQDLLEVIAASRANGALSAIARRAQVSETVSDEIVASLEIPAIATLLANPEARIREETMDRIIDQAQEAQALHEPLVMRSDLSVRAVRRIADFVAASLVERLAQRSGLDEDTQAFLRARVRDRLSEQALGKDSADEDQAAHDARERVIRTHQKGLLTPDFVGDLAAEGDRTAVTQALCLLAEVPAETCGRILRSGSAKAITALCWKAGLSMRQALDVQRTIGRVPRTELLLARHGRDYPLTEELMTWHLEFFGVAA